MTYNTIRVIINKKLIIFLSCDSCLNALKILAVLQSLFWYLERNIKQKYIKKVEMFVFLPQYVDWTYTSLSLLFFIFPPPFFAIFSSFLSLITKLNYNDYLSGLQYKWFNIQALTQKYYFFLYLSYKSCKQYLCQKNIRKPHVTCIFLPTTWTSNFLRWSHNSQWSFFSYKTISVTHTYMIYIKMTSTFPILLNVQTVDILQRFDKHVSKYESSYVIFEKLRF